MTICTGVKIGYWHVYQKIIFYQQINLIGEPFLNFNAEHLRQFDADLYRQLISYPQEVIPTFDMAVNEMFFEKNPDTMLEHQIQVRPYNAEMTKNMRSLNPEGRRKLNVSTLFLFSTKLAD